MNAKDKTATALIALVKADAGRIGADELASRIAQASIDAHPAPTPEVSAQITSEVRAVIAEILRGPLATLSTQRTKKSTKAVRP